MVAATSEPGTPGGPPEWVPAAVGAAWRHGRATAGDLHSGAAWADLLEALGRAGTFVHRATRGDEGGGANDPEAQADAVIGDRTGYHHLLVLLALGIDEALRDGDPYAPALTAGNVNNVLKWGMDCPDALYVGAPVRADASYRVHGTRGTVRYLGFQVMEGMQSTANLVADDLPPAGDGRIELLLSAEPPGGPGSDPPANWLRLDPSASSLIVRQFFYDWDHEEPARLEIECVAPSPPRRDDGGREAVDPSAGLARQLAALGSFVEASLQFWWDVEEMGRSSGLNAFRTPDARTDIGGAAENVSQWGTWQLGPGEALVVEVTPPPALYWSLAVGNRWWESLDYANHQTSLNGHQAVLDADGVFRAVLAEDDPGVANWLSTTGERRGPMIFRWLRAADPLPEVRTTVVPAADVHSVLPAGIPRVTPDERAAVLARRRAAVRRRFGR